MTFNLWKPGCGVVHPCYAIYQYGTDRQTLQLWNSPSPTPLHSCVYFGLVRWNRFHSTFTCFKMHLVFLRPSEDDCCLVFNAWLDTGKPHCILLVLRGLCSNHYWELGGTAVWTGARSTWNKKYPYRIYNFGFNTCVQGLYQCCWVLVCSSPAGTRLPTTTAVNQWDLPTLWPEDA